MEIKQIKELMAVMQRTGTKRLVIKRDGVELELEREVKTSSELESPVDLLEENPLRQEIAWHRANVLLTRGGETSIPLPTSNSQQEKVMSVNNEPAPGVYITSPMVGTFYASPSPEDPSFVKVGDKVEKGDILCIIEAMKVMNEVKSNAAGTVAEVLVQSGHPVEFGTKLFRLV